MAREARFAEDWLAMREPFDHDARSRGLAESLCEWLGDRESLRVVDLGAGSGSNPRWLAPRLPQRQSWMLLDHDRALLEAAERAPRPVSRRGEPIDLEIRRVDLLDLSDEALAGVELLTASAFFDLVSRAWLEGLCGRLAALGSAALLGLTVDGRRGFIDARGRHIQDETDTRMQRLFNRHQQRSKGLGDALGPEAAQALPRALELNRLRVRTEASDWRLAAGMPGTARLGVVLLSDWARAAAAQSPEEARAIETWHHRRRDELEAGRIGVLVGHVDVLALPPRAS